MPNMFASTAASAWPPSKLDLASLLDPLGRACREAGAAIKAVRSRGFVVAEKGDSSPVTEADHAAEAILLTALREFAPGVPVVAEEQVAAGRAPAVRELYFLVDPLDGTKEFVRGGGDYTVNVGLIIGDSPVLGLVYAPEQDRLYAGVVGMGAFMETRQVERRALRTRPRRAPLAVVASKSHMNDATEAYLARAAPGAERVSVGSSLKFGLIAEGAADLYPRLSPTSEWDTAAGHAVLLAAGGRVDGPDGLALRYGKHAFLNGWFVATGGWQPPPLVIDGCPAA